MNATTTMEERPKSGWDSIDAFLAFWLEDNPLAGPERATFEAYYATYRRRFSPYIRHHYAGQTREISAAIRAASSPSVLEVGTGCGTEALWFGLLGARVTAIDLAADRLAVARARKEWLDGSLGVRLPIEFREVSLLDFQAAEPFDVVWMEQAFHHIEPRRRVYPRLLELLRPGGHLFVSEANGWNPLLQAQLFLRRGVRTRTTIVDRHGRTVEYGNERITTAGALRRGLERAGFEVLSARAFRALPDSDPPPAWLAFEEALLGVVPALSTHFNVVARKPQPERAAR